jgi:hypothetical protein
MTVSIESCEDESYEDGSHENKGYTSEELMELVKSLSIRMEGLEEDFSCRSYEKDAEDIPVLETEVFGIPAYDE